MGLLMWDRPAKIRTPEENADFAGFDGGPTGGYQPNMSDDDARCWKARITGTKRGTPQVEIRKTGRASMITIIVCLDGGYSYKQYVPGKTRAELIEKYQTDQQTQRYYSEDEWIALNTSSPNWTNETNIHIAANGPMQFTFDELAELAIVIGEAKSKLESMKDDKQSG